MEHHVIYIPGIGDHHSYGQDIAIKYWRVFGLNGHYLPLGWRDKEGFSTKLTRLTEKIDDLTEQGHKVSLSGTSAGASAVLAAYALRPNLNGVITIAGKIHNPETISEKTRAENPDFIEAAEQIKSNLEIISQREDLHNILSIYCLNDRTVLPEDAVIQGVSEHQVPGWSHGSGIFFGVVLGAPTIAEFIKSRPH